MNFPNNEELEKLRAKYPKGTKIRLIHMNDPRPFLLERLGRLL